MRPGDPAQFSLLAGMIVGPPGAPLRREADGPEGLDRLFWQEITAYKQEKRMPFMTIFERVALEKGLLEGIEACLKLKFGAEGLELMPELRELQDHELLGAVLDAIPAAASPDELRRVWTRKRRSKKKGRA